MHAALSLQFTNEDYRASEAELLLPVRVTKSNRIRLATPVTVRVIPSTLTQHRTFSGRPDPPGTLDDDPNSPIEAGTEGWSDLLNVLCRASFLKPSSTFQKIKFLQNQLISITLSFLKLP